MAYPKTNYFHRKTRPRGPIINERIRALEVQVISSDGKNLGTLAVKEAIEVANRAGVAMAFTGTRHFKH